EQFKSDERIPRFTLVAPSVTNFLLWNDFRDPTEMVVSVAFVLDHKSKFKTDLRFEFLQLEIPLPHFFHIGERLPNSRDRHIESPFDDDRARHIILRSYKVFDYLAFIPSIFTWRRRPSSRPARRGVAPSRVDLHRSWLVRRARSTTRTSESGGSPPASPPTPPGARAQ